MKKLKSRVGIPMTMSQRENGFHFRFYNNKRTRKENFKSNLSMELQIKRDIANIK